MNKDGDDVWLSRLQRVIPGGAHTYSKGHDQYPDVAPKILARGLGPYVWDAFDRQFLDYGMGLRSVTLGYGYEPVLEAAQRAAGLGNNLNIPSMVELEAAEKLVSLIPSADMVKFAKNGSNVTTAAVKLARAYTGRDVVCVPRQHPFFSFDDWFIGSTIMDKGVPSPIAKMTKTFDYGDIQSLKALFDNHPDTIAAVMLEPSTTEIPCPESCTRVHSSRHSCEVCPKRKKNFLWQVQDLCKKNGALFVLDEMITGFRWHLSGAQEVFGVSPDLSTFGKAMANGFSCAALVGRREIMELGSIDKKGQERTFLLSSTNGAEMSSLAAFLATVAEYEAHDVCEYLWSYGEKLRTGLNGAISSLSLQEHVSIQGPDIALAVSTCDSNGEPSLDFRTLLLQELARRRVLMPAITQSYSHGDLELTRTVEAFTESLEVYREALDGSVTMFLHGKSVKPVFRKYN